LHPRRETGPEPAESGASYSAGGVSQTVQNGASTRLSVPLQSGSYELWCTVDAHKERGMDMTSRSAEPFAGLG